MSSFICLIFPFLSSCSSSTSSTPTTAVAQTTARLATSTANTVGNVAAITSSTLPIQSSSSISGSRSSSRSSSTAKASSSSSTSSAAAAATDYTKFTGTVEATILVITRDSVSADVATQGLNGYGIPFQTLLVPSGGIELPALNSSSTAGNFGGIIVDSGVVYDYGEKGYLSALTTDQWNQLYAYQLKFGVRMVQYGVYPNSDHGVIALGGCCELGVEQLFTYTNTASFTQAGLKQNAGISTTGLYHYPASITDKNTTTEIAQFAASSDGTFSTVSTAAVINNFSGREQMVYFIGFATDWSATSSFLQHAYITWMTRGLYAGYRRVNLGTQIDDMMLGTDIYYPANTSYRVSTTDMTNIASWVTTVNKKLNTGSSYYPEIGYNGNGNIIYSQDLSASNAKKCLPGAVDYDEVPETAIEFQKPLGTGTDLWPPTLKTYSYTSACLVLDPLEVWFAKTANRDKFMHLSHTFSHEELNSATYSDALREIQFNQAWLSAVGFTNGKFSSNALIPPAITGLHNGDVLKAWSTAGLTNCVGDNTRPVLRNKDNDMWPLITTVEANGYAGFQVNPRWATRIYYNCDSSACTTQEWINTSAGSGDFSNLLDIEKQDTIRHLFGLYHDPYMFHQANLRNTGNIGTTRINGVTSTISIFQAWVETVVQEFVRLADWPIITLKQADFSTSFLQRMTRDKCTYKLSHTITAGKITAVTVSCANSNTCSVPIPVTVPGALASTPSGATTEKIGNDPLTVWVALKGKPVTLTLGSAVALKG